MAENDTDNILSLETIYDRPQVAIDQRLYEITAPAELTIEQHYKLARHSKKLAALKENAGLAEAQIKQLSVHLDAICEIVLAPIPESVRSKLTDSHKQAIVEVFTMLLSEDRLRLAGGTVMKLMQKYLGEQPSPVSSDSTAEPRTAG